MRVADRPRPGAQAKRQVPVQSIASTAPVRNDKPTRGASKLSAVSAAAAAFVRDVQERRVQQQDLLLRQQHMLLQYQQAKIARPKDDTPCQRLQEEATHHRQWDEDAVRAQMEQEVRAAVAQLCGQPSSPCDCGGGPSPPLSSGGAAAGWWRVSASPEKRRADDEPISLSPLSILFSKVCSSPWTLDGMFQQAGTGVSPMGTVKRLRL